MTETTPDGCPDLPAMSRAHVLAVGAVAADVPAHLLKTLMCLAALADHRTGLVRPAGRQHARWKITKSTWHDHIKALEVLGHVEQVTLGNHEAGRAAEYLLLLPGAPSVNPAGRIPSRREGISKNNPSPSPGAGPASRIHPELSATEQEQWQRLRRALLTGLTQEDRSRLNADIKRFDQAIPLLRTLVRIDAAGYRTQVVAALTERADGSASVFARARNPARVLWARTKQIAERYGLDMFDASPAVLADDVPAGLTPAEALRRVAPQVHAWLDRASCETPVAG
jgi:hypothetical protein